MKKSSKKEGKTGKSLEKNTDREKCPIFFRTEKEGDNKKFQMQFVDDAGKKTEAIKKVFGTSDLDLINDIINKSINAMEDCEDTRLVNALVQALSDFRPQNATEAKLYAQAHVLFSQGIRLISIANEEHMMNQQAHSMKFALKCLRLHNETLQTLDKLRRGGEQKMIVQHQHFHVNDGGKAAIMAGNFKADQDSKHK